MEFPLKPLPRLKGRSTHVIITEYDLPRKEAQPHDVVMDRDGMIWYSDFSHQFVGEMDPATGKVTDIRCRRCGRTSRRARSISSSIRRAISGSP